VSGKNGKTGYYVVCRKTVKKRMRAKLQAIKAELRKRMHAPLAETGAWLELVVRGYYQYHAVPGNLAGLGLFRHRLLRLWRHVIADVARNVDRTGTGWASTLTAGWPRPTILHPFPQVRFDAQHPR